MIFLLINLQNRLSLHPTFNINTNCCLHIEIIDLRSCQGLFWWIQESLTIRILLNAFRLFLIIAFDWISKWIGHRNWEFTGLSLAIRSLHLASIGDKFTIVVSKNFKEVFFCFRWLKMLLLHFAWLHRFRLSFKLSRIIKIRILFEGRS